MKDAREQASYMMLLGGKVCPLVFLVTDDYYVMEELSEEFAHDVTWTEYKKFLWTRVWDRPYPKEIDLSWKFKLYQYLKDAEYEWLAVRIRDLCNERKYRQKDYCLIHGDPTLANLLWCRRYGELRICDPLQPKGKIPPVREVDMGKVLQSVIGWEEVIHGSDFNLDMIKESLFLEDEDDIVRELSLTWLCIHLVRILPYAKMNERDDIAQKIRKVLDDLRV